MSDTKITAAMVKQLRDTTGSPMMECKKALSETGGDVDAACEWLRKNSLAKVDKRASKTAAEGVVVMAVSDNAHYAGMVEINCETDFVAKDDGFVAFAQAVKAAILTHQPSSLESLMACSSTSASVEGSFEDWRCQLAAKVGENIQMRRFAAIASDDKYVAGYQHGGRIGVLAEFNVDQNELAKDVCMHIAATNPSAIDASQVPAETLDQERDIYLAQAQQSGKPENIINKMVEGRIQKFLKENTLLGQPFVKNPDQTVAQLLSQHQAQVLSFTRFEVGEGIEVEVKDFAQEVMEQLK